MKSILSLIFSCGVFVSAMALELTKDGQALVKIYALPDEAAAKPLSSGDPFDPSAKTTYAEQQKLMLAAALYDLTTYIEKISGAKLSVIPVNSLKDVTYPAIIAGDLAKQANLTAPASKTSEGFTLQVTDKAVFILGASPAGTAFGIYELLKQLGCAWVMPGTAGEIIPNAGTLTIPAQMTTQIPSFEIRCPWYTSSKKLVSAAENLNYLQWKMRNKLQITRKVHPLQMIGGHAWGLLTERLYKSEFAADPEMLALARQPDGSLKRQGPQLETTNPKVIALFEKYIRDIFAENKWPNDKEVSISVGPADGVGYSESQSSMAAGARRMDPVSGYPDMIDLQILLCNQLLERLEKDFPNLYLSFYLYSTHADYPARYKPHPRISICIADISYSRLHGVVEEKSRSRSYYHHILEQWGALHNAQGNPLQLRGYNWNLADNMLPCTKLKIWGEDLPFYHRMGVIGVWTEAVKAWSINGPADYLEAQMLWNVNQNWKDIFKDYCQKSFGAAAPLMEKYYLTLAERQSNAGYEAGSYFAFPQIFDRAFVRKSEELLQAAAAAVKDDAPALERVRIACIPMASLHDFLDFKDAYSSCDFTAAETIFAAMKERLRLESVRNSMTVCRAAIERYPDRFFGKFIELGKASSTGDNQIVYAFPDQLKAMIDPLDTGESFEYYRPDLMDDDYIKVRTFGSTWDAQGLDGMRRGAIWYRVKFFLPEHFRGKKIGLFLGGGDLLFRAWNNGQKVGEGVGQLKPFIFDLSSSAKFGEENVLVIKVARHGHAELGVGGLMMPSFVFAGKKIETSGGSLQLEERILPGGAREKVQKQ